MIRGIGIDSVAIERCTPWQHYSMYQLERIFSPQEIAYCFSRALCTTERLAAHFAVKEASYKALCNAYLDIKIPFLTFCKLVELSHHAHHAPTLSITWTGIQQHNPTIQPLKAHVSLTHTKSCATALVILESPYAYSAFAYPRFQAWQATSD